MEHQKLPSVWSNQCNMSPHSPAPVQHSCPAPTVAHTFHGWSWFLVNSVSYFEFAFRLVLGPFPSLLNLRPLKFLVYSGSLHNMAWNWNDGTGYVAFDSYTNGLIEAAYASGQNGLTLTHGFFAKVLSLLPFLAMFNVESFSSIRLTLSLGHIFD